MNAAEHLEHHLGRIERVWSSDDCPGVSVCLFRGVPRAGAVTLATLGLSEHVLALNDTRQVRQELLLMVRDTHPLDDLRDVLFHIAHEVMERHHALLRGDVIRLGYTLTEDSAARALYASIPVILPDEFSVLEGSAPATVFVWLVPLLPAEAQLAKELGWNDFEDRLEAADPDLLDLSRASIV